MTSAKGSILHICSRTTILDLRDQIFRIHGYEVVSTLGFDTALPLFRMQPFTLVLIDVEGEGRVAQAEKLCADIRDEKPDQKIAFVCNHRVAIESDCPDEVIRAEFNPEALVRGIQEMID